MHLAKRPLNTTFHGRPTCGTWIGVLSKLSYQSRPNSRFFCKVWHIFHKITFQFNFHLPPFRYTPIFVNIKIFIYNDIFKKENKYFLYVYCFTCSISYSPCLRWPLAILAIAGSDSPLKGWEHTCTIQAVHMHGERICPPYCVSVRRL